MFAKIGKERTGRNPKTAESLRGVPKPNTGDGITDLLFWSALFFAGYKLFGKAKETVTKSIRENIDWTYTDVKITIEQGYVVCRFSLNITNKNAYGVTLTGLRKTTLSYAGQEIGVVALPPGQTFFFKPNTLISIPIEIEKSVADIGLSLVQMVVAKTYLGKLHIQGTAQTSIGDWAIDQDVNIAQI